MKWTEYRGLLDDEAGRRSFVLRISEPQPSDKGDYYCQIDMPAVSIIGSNVRIYGMDAGQAKQLAMDFLRKMLAGKRLYDTSGRAIIV